MEKNLDVFKIDIDDLNLKLLDEGGIYYIKSKPELRFKNESIKNDLFYIGLANNVEKRLKQHETRSYRKGSESNKILYNQINTFGMENFVSKPLLYTPIVFLPDFEKFFIYIFESNNSKKGGLNSSKGGEGVKDSTSFNNNLFKYWDKRYHYSGVVEVKDKINGEVFLHKCNDIYQDIVDIYFKGIDNIDISQTGLIINIMCICDKDFLDVIYDFIDSKFNLSLFKERKINKLENTWENEYNKFLNDNNINLKYKKTLYFNVEKTTILKNSKKISYLNCNFKRNFKEEVLKWTPIEFEFNGYHLELIWLIIFNMYKDDLKNIKFNFKRKTSKKDSFFYNNNTLSDIDKIINNKKINYSILKIEDKSEL